VPGDKLKIIVCPKVAGVKYVPVVMLTAAVIEGVKNAVLETVKAPGQSLSP